MSDKAYIATLLTLVLIGSRCGISCSPNIGIVLSTNVLTYADNVKKAFVSYLAFYLGKLSSVIALCMTAHFAGEILVNFLGSINGGSVNIFLKATLVAAGIYYIITSLRKKGGCGGNCGGCGQMCMKSSDKDTRFISPFMIGLAYGITPCAPLILLLTESLAMKVWQKLLASVIFTAANAVSPVILMMIIAGVVSKKSEFAKADTGNIMKMISGAVMIISGLTLKIV
ncbi:sulfite exporter TauE/SafE family protein [Ruminococcus sp. XPD3002]|uniref:urease accessory protein UreH domain-containing protein n=1 Tax=Ruminococcus sp. XPD3002 TaxID=1452269 RepID=UPI000915E7FD|nr:Cytochrome C biogenesis protein transmembrane region [Ruminococcus flavefaciens]